MIEALVAWQKRLLESQMPFADARGRVAVLLEQLSDCQFVGMNS